MPRARLPRIERILAARLHPPAAAIGPVRPVRTQPRSAPPPPPSSPPPPPQPAPQPAAIPAGHVRIRFRDDHSFAADDAARRVRGEKMIWHRTVKELERTPPAVPGDTWRVRWRTTTEQEAQGITEGPIAGYAMCCPKCAQVHHWTTATNCASKRALPEGGAVCDHSGTGSCWEWTGSAEQGTLSASPSLWCQESLGGCGFHGFLRNGVLG